LRLGRGSKKGKKMQKGQKKSIAFFAPFCPFLPLPKGKNQSGRLHFDFAFWRLESEF
jgi:hypothetical protein